MAFPRLTAAAAAAAACLAFAFAPASPAPSSLGVLVSSDDHEDVYTSTGTMPDGRTYVATAVAARIPASARAAALAAVPAATAPQVEEVDYSFLPISPTRTATNTNFGYYDNCPSGAVTIYINQKSLPSKAARDAINNAINQVQSQTGLIFQIQDTDVVPYTSDKWEAPFVNYDQRSIYVAFSNGSKVPGLKDPLIVGIGGPVGLQPNDGRPYELLVSAVVIDTDIPAKIMPRTVLHEFGHAFGLGHAPTDTKEVMYATVTGTGITWNLGDKTALDILYNQLPNFRC